MCSRRGAMTELGGLLAAALLKVLAAQIGSAIGRQIALQKNLSSDLEKMKMALESVEAVLEDAEARSITDRSTTLWLKRLKVAMYAISDMIDEFEDDTEAITQPSKWKSSLKGYFAVGPKITIANKMKKMRDDLEVITDEYKKFTFASPYIYSNERKAIDIRETSSLMETHVIVGRDEERTKILCSLSESMTKEMTILPIYGIGGLGKTTLAKIVYNSSQFRSYSRVWVYVSQNLDLKKIGNSIISQLSENETHQVKMQMIQNSLEKLLASKKTLIVLDDLWEDKESHYDSLKAMLKIGKESKVIVVVTTRAEGIARKISTIQPHKLEPLTDGMCWSIIKQKSAFESRDDKEHLGQIGMDIAMKCGGVALAAQSIGHMLHSMTSNEWESMRKSDIWNIYSVDDTLLTHVLASLRLSYSVMPPYLKLCFAYCAIFPKGHKIVKDDLIHQWFSLGLIEPPNVFSFWQLGERYIRQLLGLSFLQYSTSHLIAEVYHEDFTLFTMHDLVHDLARSVMVDEILLAARHGNTGGSYCQYALLNDCSKPLELSKIRALRFMDCGETELHDAAFSSAKSLRVLDLSKCSIHKLPDCIGLLRQLRYLNAPKVQHTLIPDSITKLSKLIYLNLHGSLIMALPESIGDIEGLMYLDLSDCSQIEKLPDSFQDLKNVVHLDLSNCSRLEGVSLFLGSLKKLLHLNLSFCPNIGKLSEALGGLSELQYLNLSYSSFVKCCREVEVLSTLTKLEYLNLSSESCLLEKLPEAIGGFVKLKYLNLSGCHYMKELPVLFGNLKNMLHLDLSDCYQVNGVPQALRSLTNLRYLNLSVTSDADQQCLGWLPEVIRNLTELRCLNLSNSISQIFDLNDDMPSEDSVDSLMCSICTLLNLEHLDLSNNYGLHSIPGSISNLRKLHTLNISRCHFLGELPQLSSNLISLPRFVVHAGDGECSSNLVLLEDTDPVELHITKLENVKSTEEAQRLGFMEKQRLAELTLGWSRDAESIVEDKMLLEKLVPPRNLKKLRIQGYRSGNCPAWLMDIRHYLPNLIRLEMCDMPNCNVLPLSHLPNLNSLVLKGLKSLEEWNTSYSVGQEHIIATLVIDDCPKLRIRPLPPRAKWLEISRSDSVLSSWEEYTCASKTSSYLVETALWVKYCALPMHQWRLLQHLPGLTCLLITGCGDLTGSPEIIQHLSSLKSLNLQDRDQQVLPEWLGELKSLRALVIYRCSGLHELDERAKLLTKLHSLQLYNCNNITSLPHWLGELTSLEKLLMWDCDLIDSLPEGIKQLSNLQELDIKGCPALKKCCDLEDGKIKLTPNQERACVLPTSLRELRIVDCPGISYLPEGIQQLTNLQKIEINFCPELKQWLDLEENVIKLAHIETKVIC